MVVVFLGIWFKKTLSAKSAQTSETTASDSQTSLSIYDHPRRQEYENLIIKIKYGVLFSLIIILFNISQIKGGIYRECRNIEDDKQFRECM